MRKKIGTANRGSSHKYCSQPTQESTGFEFVNCKQRRKMFEAWHVLFSLSLVFAPYIMMRHVDVLCLFVCLFVGLSVFLLVDI